MLEINPRGRHLSEVIESSDGLALIDRRAPLSAIAFDGIQAVWVDHLEFWRRASVALRKEFTAKLRADNFVEFGGEASK
jgi:hypothetical protein